MKPLRFPFTRVLRVRRLQEVGARAEFLEARSLESAARARAELARGAEREAREALSELQSRAHLAPREVVRQQESLDELEGVTRRLAGVARQLEARAEGLRTVWQERRAEVLGLERLEELRKAAHVAERERAEAREADERALASEGFSGSVSRERTESGSVTARGSRSGRLFADGTFEGLPRPAPHSPPVRPGE